MSTCPFCNRTIKSNAYVKEIVCRNHDHTFIQCYEDDLQVTKLVIRVLDAPRYYIKVNYVKNITRAWSGIFTAPESQIVTIPIAMTIDFSKGMTGIRDVVKSICTFT